jgi:hypothetical protein
MLFKKKEVMLKISAKSEQLSPLGLKGTCNLVFGRGWGGILKG